MRYRNTLTITTWLIALCIAGVCASVSAVVPSIDGCSGICYDQTTGQQGTCEFADWGVFKDCACIADQLTLGCWTKPVN